MKFHVKYIILIKRKERVSGNFVCYLKAKNEITERLSGYFLYEN